MCVTAVHCQRKIILTLYVLYACIFLPPPRSLASQYCASSTPQFRAAELNWSCGRKGQGSGERLGAHGPLLSNGPDSLQVSPPDRPKHNISQRNGHRANQRCGECIGRIVSTPHRSAATAILLLIRQVRVPRGIICAPSWLLLLSPSPTPVLRLIRPPNASHPVSHLHP